MARLGRRTRPLLLAALTLVQAAPALADGRAGFGFAAGIGAAGGAQASTSSGLPAATLNVELGAHLNNGNLFGGIFGDRFNSSLWQAGITGKQFFGSDRRLWVQIKVALSGMAGMIGSSATVKTWDNYLNGGLGAGMRFPVSAQASIQPYFEFDSFMPILGTTRVSTGPGETSLKFITGSRCNIPMAGLKFALEL